MARQHLIWVDVVKGICIVAMVLLHINYDYEFSDYLHVKSLLGNSWHMPVLMMVSGFFLSIDKMTQTVSFLWHKLKTLYSRQMYFYIPILLLHNVFLTVGLYNPEHIYVNKTMHEMGVTEYLQKLVEVMFFMGREPYASAMWFVYVLFMAFIIMSVLAFLIRQIAGNDERKIFVWLGIVLAMLCCVSLYFTNVLGITVPRCNNVFTSMWLVYMGYTVRNRVKLSFDNKVVFTISLIALAGVLLNNPEMGLMTNSYRDIAHLSVCALSALYIIAFISKRIENSIAGKVLACIGDKSFYVMALHLLAINISVWVFNVISGSDIPIYILGCKADNIVTLLALATAGITIPVILALTFDKLRQKP